MKLNRLTTMLLGLLFCISTFAQKFEFTHEGQTLRYTVLDPATNTCEVAGFPSAAEESSPEEVLPVNLIIPSTVTNEETTYTVVSVGHGSFFECSQLESVEIPETVTTISHWAFASCTGLTDITIPTGVNTIGLNAFKDCSGLTSVKLLCNRAIITEYAFDGCTNLERAEFESIKSLCRLAFANKQSNPLFFAHNLYIDGEEIKELKIPDDIQIINNCAFAGSNITSIDFGNPVVVADDVWYAFKIGEYAFANCTNLRELTIPEKTTSIGKCAFTECTGLTEVFYNAIRCTSSGGSAFPSTLPKITIGENVKIIPTFAFSECSGLTEIKIPASVETIKSYAFYNCTGLTKAEFSSLNALLNIDFENGSSNPLDYAHHLFINGEEITELAIPETVSSIGKHTFSGCSAITSIVIPNSVTSFGTAAFYGCSGLTEIILPNSIKSLSNEVFIRCEGLKSVTMPASLETIGNSAFRGCSSLTSITIPQSVTTIGEYAFYDCPELTEVYYNAINCENYGTRYPLIHAVAFSSSVQKIVFGNQVTIIPDYTFNECSDLTEISFGESIKTIGKFAFSKCSKLISIELPNSVTTIGNSAFSNCSSLSSLKFGDSIKSIGHAAFYACSSLTSLLIPNGVEEIGNSAFSGCSSLREITMEGLLSSVGYNAFVECTELMSVNIHSPNLWSQTEFFGTESNPICRPKTFRVDGKEVHHIDLDINDCSVNTEAFNYADNLISARIKGKGIGIRSFQHCNNLTLLCLDVNSVKTDAFTYCDNIRAIYCMREEPPVSPDNAFSSVCYGNAILYVPAGSKEKYENAECWSRFNEIIESDFAGVDTIFKADYIDNEKPSDIEDIIIDTPSSAIDFNSDVEVYTLNGIKVAKSIDNLTPGFYIIRQGNTTKKIVIR